MTDKSNSSSSSQQSENSSPSPSKTIPKKQTVATQKTAPTRKAVPTQKAATSTKATQKAAPAQKSDGVVRLLQDKNKLDEVLKKNPNTLIVVKFYATWCGPCKMMAPKLAKMASDFKDVIFAKMDVEEETCQEVLLDKYSVDVTPTYILFKKGGVVTKLTGMVANELRAAIEKNK